MSALFFYLGLSLAQDFGSFILQTELTTYANTLLEQTNYILPNNASPPSGVLSTISAVSGYEIAGFESTGFESATSAFVSASPESTYPVSTIPVPTTPVSTAPVSTTPVSTTPVSTTPVSTSSVIPVSISNAAVSTSSVIPASTTSTSTTPTSTIPTSVIPTSTIPTSTIPISTIPTSTTSTSTTPTSTASIITSAVSASTTPVDVGSPNSPPCGQADKSTKIVTELSYSTRTEFSTVVVRSYANTSSTSGTVSCNPVAISTLTVAQVVTSSSIVTIVDTPTETQSKLWFINLDSAQLQVAEITTDGSVFLLAEASCAVPVWPYYHESLPEPLSSPTTSSIPNQVVLTATNILNTATTADLTTVTFSDIGGATDSTSSAVTSDTAFANFDSTAVGETNTYTSTNAGSANTAGTTNIAVAPYATSVGTTNVAGSTGTTNVAGSTVGTTSTGSTIGTTNVAGSTTGTTNVAGIPIGTTNVAGSTAGTTNVAGSTAGTTNTGSTAGTTNVAGSTAGTTNVAGSTAGTTNVAGIPIGTTNVAGSTAGTTNTGSTTGTANVAGTTNAAGIPIGTVVSNSAPIWEFTTTTSGSLPVSESISGTIEPSTIGSFPFATVPSSFDNTQDYSSATLTPSVPFATFTATAFDSGNPFTTGPFGTSDTETHIYTGSPSFNTLSSLTLSITLPTLPLSIATVPNILSDLLYSFNGVTTSNGPSPTNGPGGSANNGPSDSIDIPGSNSITRLNSLGPSGSGTSDYGPIYTSPSDLYSYTLDSVSLPVSLSTDTVLGASFSGTSESNSVTSKGLISSSTALSNSIKSKTGSGLGLTSKASGSAKGGTSSIRASGTPTLITTTLSAQQTSVAIQGYSCGQLGSDSDVIVCSKNAQPKIRAPSTRTQITFYSIVMLALVF